MSRRSGTPLDERMAERRHLGVEGAVDDRNDQAQRIGGREDERGLVPSRPVDLEMSLHVSNHRPLSLERAPACAARWAVGS